MVRTTTAAAASMTWRKPRPGCWCEVRGKDDYSSSSSQQDLELDEARGLVRGETTTAAAAGGGGETRPGDWSQIRRLQQQQDLEGVGRRYKSLGNFAFLLSSMPMLDGFG